MPAEEDHSDSLILVADDDADIRRLVVTYLELEGFRVEEARDGREAVAQAAEVRPDLIILDIMMPHLSGTEAMEAIRQDFRTAYIPIVFLSAKSLTGDKVGHLLGGADDYITKPFDPQELVARVEVALRRSKALRGLNPLSGLPGNTVIQEEMAERLAAERDFTCLYVDLDNFKALNDHYGFARGDDVLRTLAGVLLEALDHANGADHFAGHVGGDDFVVLTEPDDAEPIAEEIIRRFDAAVGQHYDAEDRDRGWIEVEDRQGRPQRYPVCTVSIGIVHASTRDFTSAAEMAEIAAEVKGVAKRDEGSNWAIDRRQD